MNTPNNKQLEAINSIGNTVVIAGAGSGKTKTYVNKLKLLLKKTNKYNILGLTFTEKASNNFKEDLEEDMPYLGTFHSVFFKIIINKVDYLADSKILADTQYFNYLNNHFNNDTFNNKQFNLKLEDVIKLDKIINQNINLVLESDNRYEFFLKIKDILLNDYSYVREDINIIEDFYWQKKEDKVLSFTDILFETYFAIKENEDLREALKNQFKYIMIDEFQDTNKIVLEIINYIQKDNLFVVGDIYQSIYSFQGSSFEDTLNLMNKIDNVIQLDTNYRSSENIVNLANDFIENFITNTSDKIKPVKAHGDKKNNKITVIEKINDFTIPQIIHNSKDDLNDICILARENNHLEEIKDILDKWNVPYNFKDDKEFEMFLNAILLMIDVDYEANDKYFDRFDMKNIKNQINDYLGIEDKHIYDYLELIRAIIKENHILNYFDNKGYKDLQKIYDTFEDRLIKLFLNDRFDIYTDNILRRLELYLENEDYIDKYGVNIMTIHKSKGLEWNTVILYNFEDNVFPRNLMVEEEKRIHYVAITRAKENLYITSKDEINTYTRRFLKKDYINHRIITDDEKYSLNFEYEHKDIIDFKGTTYIAFKRHNYITKGDRNYIENYIDYNSDKLLDGFILSSNKIIQKYEIRNVNKIKFEDILVMVSEIKSFQEDNSIDNIELKNKVLAINTDINKYIKKGLIDFDYLNNKFTDDIHEIINYKNWIDETEQTEDLIKNDELQIKRFKKVVIHLISKKYTDMIKDKSKKAFEIRQRTQKNKIKNSNLETYDDIVNIMRNTYIDKSNKEKKYYVENMIGMYNTLGNKYLIDFTDDKYKGLLNDIMIDFEYNKDKNDFVYQEEQLAGNFLNGRKTQLANKRIAKMKYIEAESENLRPYFLTFTLPTKWHRWKLTNEAVNNKAKRKYGDKNILIENPYFELQGYNFEEHIINSAKQINEIWTSFYDTIKKELNDLKRKNKKLLKNKKMTQREYDSYLYDYTNFFKVLEPHKNLTAHGHILFFIDEKLTYIIEKSFKKTIEKFELNIEYNDIQRINKKSDTELGKLNIILEKLNYEIEESLNDNLINISTIRNMIKDYDKFETPFFKMLNSNLPSRNELKKQLKEELKINRLDYVKIEKLKREKEKIENKIAEYKLSINNKIAEYTEKFGANSEEVEKLGRKLNDNIASPSTYIFKYTMKNMKKSYDKENEDLQEQEEERVDNILFFNAWESILGNKARVVSMSSYKHTTQREIDKMWKWYKDNAPQQLEDIKKSGKSVYKFLEKAKLNGSFVFSYHRRVKENFKLADFTKDVEIIFNNLIEENNDVNACYETATNLVLNNGRVYLNIHTDKKLVEVLVNNDFYKNNLKDFDEIVIDFTIEKEEKHYLTLEDPEERANDIYSKLYDNIKIVNGITYNLIINETMYVNKRKAMITINQEASREESSYNKESIEKLPNHINNIRYDNRTAFIKYQKDLY